jgi:hypothetical protein
MTHKRITMWKSKTLHTEHAFDLETPDIDKVALNANSPQKQMDI